MEKHMKNALKLISLLMILGLALVSCGAPGAKTQADIDYKKTMNDILPKWRKRSSPYQV
jgi:hypothetical protein